LPVFIPHNATAVINGLDKWYSTHTSLDNSSWVAGPNGYDGTYSIWKGLGAEEPDTWKDEFNFNSEGVMESYSAYNATGSEWALLIKFELESTSEIPGFPIYTTCIAFGLSVIMAVVLLRKKEIL
jgi:hypothetical protein